MIQVQNHNNVGLQCDMARFSRFAFENSVDRITNRSLFINLEPGRSGLQGIDLINLLKLFVVHNRTTQITVVMGFTLAPLADYKIVNVSRYHMKKPQKSQNWPINLPKRWLKASNPIVRQSFSGYADSERWKVQRSVGRPLVWWSFIWMELNKKKRQGWEQRTSPLGKTGRSAFQRASALGSLILRW